MRLKNYHRYVEELQSYLFDLIDRELENTEQYKYLEREFKLYTPLEPNKNWD